MTSRFLIRVSAAVLLSITVLSSITRATDPPKERTSARSQQTPQQTTQQTLPFEPTETLIYEGEFSKLLLRGVNIAELRFEARRPTQLIQGEGDEQGRNSAPYMLATEIESKGIFSKLFGITFHFRAESTVEAETFTVLRTTKKDEQGKRVRSSEALFDYDANRVKWTERDPNNESQPPRVVTGSLEGPTHDIVSALYFLRTRRLVPGEQFEINISDSGQTYRVPGRVFAEKKKMKSIIGRVSVVRLEVEMFGEGRPIEGKGRTSIWVTDDERRIPIKARISHDLGQLDMTLKRIERAAAR